MSCFRSLSKNFLGASIALLMTLTAKSGNAAVVGVDDSGSYIGGSNTVATTIAPLGYQILPVIDSSAPDGSTVPFLALSDGSGGFVNFNQALTKATAPDFLDFGHGYAGPIYVSANNYVNISLPAGTEAFDFYIAPTSFSQLEVIATATDDSTTIVDQLVSSANGSKYFGFYSDTQQPIKSVAIKIPAATPQAPPVSGAVPGDILAGPPLFAIGQFRVSSPAIGIPEPSGASGALAFGALSVGYLLKRQLKKSVT